MKTGIFKLTFFLCCFLFFTLNSYSQTENFKLSDYKNPDYKYHSLDLGLNLHNNYSNTYLNNNGTGVTSSSTSANNSVSAYYTQQKNSIRNKSGLNLSLDGLYMLSFPGHQTKNKNSNLTERIDLNGYYTRFYNKNWFWRSSYSFTHSFYADLENSDHVRPNDQGSFPYHLFAQNYRTTLSGSASFVAGKGRVEQVEDAQLAIYILDDLKKNGALNRDATNEEIGKLANLITELKFKRAFDTRLKRIDDMKQLDSLLVTNGLAKSGIEYFTSLNDMWDYAFKPSRLSGNDFYGGLKLGDAWSFDYIYTKTDTSVMYPDYAHGTFNNSLNPSFILGLGSYKPINIRWQRDAYLYAGISCKQMREMQRYYKNTPDLIIKTSEHPIITINGNYGYSFYPNTRTWFDFDWRLNAFYNRYNAKPENRDVSVLKTDLNISTGPHIGVYYYISPRLLLSASLELPNQFSFSRNYNHLYNEDGSILSSVFDDHYRNDLYFIFGTGLVFKVF